MSFPLVSCKATRLYLISCFGTPVGASFSVATPFFWFARGEQRTTVAPGLVGRPNPKEEEATVERDTNPKIQLLHAIFPGGGGGGKGPEKLARNLADS